jgi:hypothetical protein
MCRNMEKKEESEEHTFPLRMAIPLVVLYLMLCAFVVYVFDYQLRGEQEEGLTVRFCFAINKTKIILGRN